MHKNNILLLFLLIFPATIFAAAPAKSILQTAHNVQFDSKAFGDSLGAAFAKVQVGVNIDHAALGQALAKAQVGVNMDLKALGEALAKAQINIDPVQLQNLLKSKEVQETIANLKIIPSNFTINPIKFALDKIPHVPVDLTLKLSAENGRRVVAAASGVAAVAAMAYYQTVGCVSCALLSGSAAALCPEKAGLLVKLVCDSDNYTYDNCCCKAMHFTVKTAHRCYRKYKALEAAKIPESPKPGIAEAKRD